MNKRRFSLLLDQVVFSGSSFLITLLLAQRLEIGVFGQYSGYLLVNYLLAGAIGAFSIQPFQVMQGRTQQTAAYRSFACGLQLAIIAILVLTGCLALCILPGAFPWSFLVFTSGFLIHDFGRRMLLAMDKPFLTLILDTVTAMLSLLALYSGTAVESGLEALFLVLALPYLASFLLLWRFVMPVLPQRAEIWRYALLHWQEGKWLFLTAVSQWWSGNLFVVASGIYLGAQALGALRLAQTLMGVLNMLLQTFENYLLPQTALRMHPAPEVGIAYLSRLSRLAAAFFLPVLATVFVCAKPIMAMAGGPGYAHYAFALQGMSLLYLLVFISQPVRLALRALVLNKQFFTGYLFSLAFAIATSHQLLSTCGLTGAIIGLGISQAILIIYWTIVLQKRNILLWKSFISF